MKGFKIVLVLIILLIITGGFLFWREQNNSITAPTVFPSASTVPTTSAVPDCTTSELKVDIQTEGAAGSIYSNIKATNTSAIACNVILGNSISAKYSASNISVNYENQSPVQQNFILQPNTSAYSQVRVPNGPQCQSTISQQKVDFIYNNQTVGSITIQACSAANENTAIEIWPLSSSPITQ
ncbi:MAG TPA: DUF4232 domain-containing protein [Patescibacteria group bacterium]|nr:DUF4232 domain-containing protein [Patescibacteria group bacterium]